MEILEYNQVDPLQVLSITQLALDFALTPELAAHIRQTDPRPFPCLAIYAVEDELVMGQVGIFRLPMVSIEGRQDVGGIWAVCTHPHFAGRGVASLLLEEAHNRMREAGLRFSTLGTDRFRTAHRLYRRHGYEETNILATALARWETAYQPTRLRAQPAAPEGYEFVEQVYYSLAEHYLGFSWRHSPFERLRRVELSGIWILRESQRVVGYALTRIDRTMLHVTNFLLGPQVDAAEAIAALAAEVRSVYIQVKISRPVDIASLSRAGFHLAHPTWEGFMIKPLVPDAAFEDARRLFGIGTDRFLISWLDVT
jgi:GNAT superfamily N-acetyltransferase